MFIILALEFRKAKSEKKNVFDCYTFEPSKDYYKWHKIVWILWNTIQKCFLWKVKVF